MTTTKKHRARIQITSRHGKIRPHVRHAGWLDVDGALAVLVIAIILAVRLVRTIIAFVWPIARTLAARFARGSVHYITGFVLAFRAFYIP